MAKTRFLSEKNEVDVELALVTMALLPDDEAAAVQLKEQHGITTTAARLAVVRRRFAEQFQKAREGVAVQQEKALISDLGDNAKLAGVAIQLAVKRTLELLAEGRVQDPSRVARDVADVQAKAIDKSRLLQDKPTVIVAKPKMAEIISGLESLGVIEADAEDLSDAPKLTA
jgi:predicted DNA-binding protein (UPF0251 family)